MRCRCAKLSHCSAIAGARRGTIWVKSHFSSSHDTVIRVYDDAGTVLETHVQTGDFESGKVFHRTERLFLGKFRREPKKTKEANDISRRAMKWYGNHSR
jgi:hypothetical protein